MRNSLLLKLLGAFALVIAINALAISLLTSTATRSAFELYTTRSGQIWGERIARYLAEYYAETNSWEGVDSILKSGLSPQELVGGGVNRGGQGRGNGAARHRPFSPRAAVDFGRCQRYRRERHNRWAGRANPPRIRSGGRRCRYGQLSPGWHPACNP